MIIFRISENSRGRSLRFALNEERFLLDTEYIFSHRLYENIPMSLRYGSTEIYRLENGIGTVLKHKSMGLRQFTEEDATIIMLKGAKEFL